jgi:hypothetical protein
MWGGAVAIVSEVAEIERPIRKRLVWKRRAWVSGRFPASGSPFTTTLP